ncbi:LysR family transcriptional regulator [Variovorax sp. KK3]|uniref:LysR family transcriptional regulator n=1 Tax=Variovorax sp. KK3 TaxID=1855728 RepID=UPI00097C3563|nr:LysR substrate-binding domain-containing protein [Variovorax sp. KK3]
MTISTKRRLPPISHIEAFLSVMRLRSITAASEELFLTQGAVSKQVQEFEKFVGGRVFNRSPQGLQPTAFGQALYERLSPLVTALSAAFVDARAQTRSVLNISVPPSVGMEILAPRLREFQETNPEHQINLITRVGEVDLDWESLDAAVISGIPRSTAYVSERLFTPALHPYVSPSLLTTGTGPGLDVLATGKLIAVANMVDAWPDYFATLGLPFEPTQVASVHSMLSTSAQAVISGFGIALLPAYVADQHARAGAMVRISEVPYLGMKPYYLLARRQVVSSEAFQAFRNWLVPLLAAMDDAP